ncbi:hypothetical protein L910_2351 [Vibrio fluvialis PG41]|uniref:G domain-containing protein n=1 Tax=Vibrio fluvialis PG41 TaxID=1336752 RepID=S7HWW2_VIBFL|nr:GTPase [Vibrio fluvialis]EPP20152.1 hypothetical protein L910_2351 [Vibrio fluvialis PG41]
MFNSLKKSLYDFITPSKDEEIIKANDKLKDIVPTLWLFGKTGAGKSSLVKYITKQDDVEVGNGFMPCTKVSSIFPFPSDKPIVSFLDTRGLCEASYDPTEDIEHLSIDSNVILLVMRLDDPSQKDILSSLKKVKKSKSKKILTNHLIVIHTFCSQLSEEDRNRMITLQNSEVEKVWGSNFKSTHVDFDSLENIDALNQLLVDELPLVSEALFFADDEGDNFAYSRLKKDIIWYSLAAGAADAIPVAGAFTVPTIQGKMLYDLAAKLDLEWNKKEFLEFTGSLGTTIAIQFGASFLIRQATKFIPVYGQTAGAAISASVGFAATFALGKAACLYMCYKKKGVAVNSDELQRVFKEAFDSKKDEKTS